MSMDASRHDALAKCLTAIEDIRPHVDAWISLLQSHVDSLDADMPEGAEYQGRCDRSYAEHELRAMRRGLAALLSATL